MITVRAAAPADVDAICDICASAYRATYPGLMAERFIEGAIADFYTPERVAGEIAAAPPKWLGYQVVEEDGQVLGAAGGGVTAPGTGELFVIYLDPAQRGRGLGTLLLDRITAQLKDAGATEMWVAVVDGNTKGEPFYRARGFERVERRRTYGVPEEADAWTWRMRRPI